MKKKFFNMLPFIIIVSIIIFIGINIKNSINESKDIGKKDTKVCNIDMDIDGYIKVVELMNIVQEKNDFGRFSNTYYFLDLTLYSSDLKNNIENLKVFVDGNEIYENRGEKIYYTFYYDSIDIYGIKYGEHSINIEYNVNSKIVSQYSNLSLLKILNNKNFLDYKVKINFQREVSLFKTDSEHAKVKKIENNSYEIDMTNTSKIIDSQYTELKLNRYIVKDPTIIDQHYNIINKINSENDFSAKYLLILLVMTIFVFIVVKLLTIRRVIYRKHIKSTKMVLEPIFAESLIDGKIGAKELIMSCIMNLIYRKKIDIIKENEKIKIIDDNELTKYENDIINLVFDGKMSISFQELKNKYSNIRESVKFSERLEEIEDDINKYFFDEGIYSRIGEKILLILKILSLSLSFNFIPLTLSFVKLIEVETIYVMMATTIIAGTIFSNWRKLNSRRKFKRKKYSNILFGLEQFKFSSCVFLFGTIYILVLFTIFESNMAKSFWAVLILILNIISFKSSKTHCLTEKGMKEYNKVYGLKQYIKDYGLMEQREMDGIQVWDEYLVYACAFGISTKITEKIDEDALKINIFLKNFDDFLRY